MFINLKEYVVENEEQKKEERKNEDSEFWENIENMDINDLEFTKNEKIEIFCLILICSSVILIILGSLTLFNVIDINKLVRALKYCTM